MRLRQLSVVTRQRGIVLIAAMIALVLMTMAGLALVRSMDTGLVIAGNVAFKQATVNAASHGGEEAIQWLNANASAPKPVTCTVIGADRLLDCDDATNAYYATYRAPCDLTANTTSATLDDVNWIDADHPSGTAPSNGNCGMTAKAVPNMPAGFSASYVINRMCVQQGSKSSPGTGCAPFQSSGDDLSKSTKNAVDYRRRGLPAMSSVYYRITTRVVGPRNTVSYVQALVGL
jgi:Tfp pilus assembly protein PilX